MYMYIAIAIAMYQESKFGWLLYRHTTHVQLRASDPLADFCLVANYPTALIC